MEPLTTLTNLHLATGEAKVSMLALTIPIGLSIKIKRNMCKYLTHLIPLMGK